MLLLRLLPLVHFDGRGPWTCCLVHNLDLTFAYLYCGCVVLLSLSVGPWAHFFIRGYWWQPFRRTISLQMALCHLHSVALREHRLTSIWVENAIVVCNGHLRIVPHFSLLDHLRNLRRGCASQIYFVCHASIQFVRLGWLRCVFMTAIGLVQEALTVLNSATLLGGYVGVSPAMLVVRELTVVRDNDIVIESLVDNRLNWLALLLRISFDALVRLTAYDDDWVVQIDLALLLIRWDDYRLV